MSDYCLLGCFCCLTTVPSSFCPLSSRQGARIQSSVGPPARFSVLWNGPTVHHSQAWTETSSDETSQLFQWKQASVMAFDACGILHCHSGRKRPRPCQHFPLSVRVVWFCATESTSADTLLISHWIMCSAAMISIWIFFLNVCFWSSTAFLWHLIDFIFPPLCSPNTFLYYPQMKPQKYYLVHGRKLGKPTANNELLALNTQCTSFFFFFAMCQHCDELATCPGCPLPPTQCRLGSTPATLHRITSYRW